jgi:redox-sensitive bicupin YhaK (pirin superfamily)
MLSEWLYAEVSLAAGASAPLDRDPEDRAIYVVEGEVEIAGETFEAPRLLVFQPGSQITVRATRPARLMFLGGAVEGPRYITSQTRRARTSLILSRRVSQKI